MEQDLPFQSWRDLGNAALSAFFHGKTADTIFDQSRNAFLMPSSEGLFTHSNARILLGQAANGSLRIIALPTQVYPAPTGMGEFGLGPGMYYHFDAAMYVGNLSYRLVLTDRDSSIDLAAENLNNETYYADHFLPVTVSHAWEDLEIRLVSLAPVAPDGKTAPLSPAPLPGPAGALYVLVLHNYGNQKLEGKVILQAGDLLVGHYEDAEPLLREMNRPTVSIRQQTLILSRPEGAVGVHFHQGRWNTGSVPFQSERSFVLEAGQEAVFETYLGMGKSYQDVMPVIYDLYRRDSLEWLNLTTAFWRSRLGRLEVDAADASEQARMGRDLYLRCLLDNFNCLQTDVAGNLIAHWQGAPAHGYGTIWGIDVEPTAVSVAHLVPEMTRQVMLFFLTRSRAPRGPLDHSIPILVAPIILARQWLQASGDEEYLKDHLEILDSLEEILNELLAMKAPGETLFPSRYSSDGPVGRRYDYGTNVKVYYAFESMAYIKRLFGWTMDAGHSMEIARGIQDAIARRMVVEGPFGRQISGGTNLGEDLDNFYSPEELLYYDGEDTSSMLAPIYGACDFDDETWINYHRFARSLWCPTYDPEFDTLRWSPAEPGVVDGTAFFSRLGGAVTRTEMREAFDTLRRAGIDDVTGSVFWWPHGRQYKRSLTRCSQGQGAWAWQYLEEWLGIRPDANARRLVVAPRGLLTHFRWEGFRSGANLFDLEWNETLDGASVRVKNRCQEPWIIQAGFRQPGAGANGPLNWQMGLLEPGEEKTLQYRLASPDVPRENRLSMDHSEVLKLEADHWGEQGVLFRRFGMVLLWGHWDLRRIWDMHAMPLALRFVIGNVTGSDWTEVRVDLHAPQGWKAQGRQPLEWPKPDQLAEGCVTLHLGRIPAGERVAAPFWIQGPEAITLSRMWDDIRPFHVPSQPGPEVDLWISGIDVEAVADFKAVLRANSATGEEIVREIGVPVKIHPAQPQQKGLIPYEDSSPGNLDTRS